MLAGPNAPAPMQAPAPTNWRADAPAAAPTAPAPHLTPAVYEIPEPELAPAGNPFAYAAAEEPLPRFDAPAPAPMPMPMTPYSGGTLPSFERDEEAAMYAPIPLSPPKPIVERSEPIVVLESKPEPQAAVPGPLAMLSRGIEWCCELFGPPGQMLTTPAGKNLLGVVGIGLIVSSAVYCAHGYGWLRLPFLP
jgi:hypothetical protein